jgi:hypothetical protein
MNMRTQAEKGWRILSSRLKQWMHDRPWSKRGADSPEKDSPEEVHLIDAPEGVYVTTADFSDEHLGLAAPGAFTVQAEGLDDAGNGGVYGVIYDPKNNVEGLDWAESLAMQDRPGDAPSQMITDTGSYLALPEGLSGADAESGGWDHVVYEGSIEGGFEAEPPPQPSKTPDRNEVITGHAEGRLNLSDVFNDRKSI